MSKQANKALVILDQVVRQQEEIESLRQRVKELEKRIGECELGFDTGTQIIEMQREEIAALKAGQSEPVAVVTEKIAYDQVGGNYVGRGKTIVPIVPIQQLDLGTKLYTSAPTIPECEHHFVRDEEAINYSCCQKCGLIIKDAAPKPEVK